MQSICVFCGSNAGARPGYDAAAAHLGRVIAARGLTLVYGGSKVGLMGTIANAALHAGGAVHGIIPQSLVDKELAHNGLTRFEVVGSMHARKQRMAELSDGFVALPGGAGTLEEIFEVWTWAQLGMHGKPVGFLNVERYYDKLIGFLDQTVRESFVKPQLRDMLIVEAEPEPLLDRYAAYEPPVLKKWISREET